jgi:hypothetical protein
MNTTADSTTAATTAVTTSDGSGSSAMDHHAAVTPEFVLREVRLLLRNLTTPETNVSFATAARADSGSIENVIRPPTPEPTWIWADSVARAQQHVSEIDIGKYGLQTDIHKLFKLASISPVVWQPVRDFTVATWTWRNQRARENEAVLAADVGKIGYQVDIDKYFILDQLNPTVWKLAANPNAGPFEISTGASDAVAYHDYYRLQIAFEDVWAELLDDSIGTTAQAFYAKWDALMNEGQLAGLAGEQYTAELNAASNGITASRSLVATLRALNGMPQQAASVYTQALALMQAAAGAITGIENAASDSFKNSFGLDLQNILAELQVAASRLNLQMSAAQANSVDSALDAALKMVTAFKNKLSQAAAARIAAFDLIPPDDIGGIEQLENFLNDVRIILGLPAVMSTTTTSSAPKEDYDARFEGLILNLQSAKDFLQSLVYDLKYYGVHPNQIANLQQSTLGSIEAALVAAAQLRDGASPAFKQSYASDLSAIVTQVTDVRSKFSTWVVEIANGWLGPQHVDDTANLPANVTVTSPAIVTAIGTARSSVENLRSRYKAQPAPAPSQSQTFVASDLKFPEIESLFKRLSDMLKERYRFDVFAPGSINYGLLLNYRQKWTPQSYQVGSLVKTIPLGAGEVQKYTTKLVTKKSRSAKELDESLRSSKEDKSVTQRIDAEIFSSANEKTDFNANAQGSFKIGVYDVNAQTHFGKDQGVDSKNTKRDQRESVLKSAQEYRNQHRLEVSTDTSREDESTSYRELRNPNDELTVTYLFYELQRRYLVSDSLYKATPVIMVANDVPTPTEIDQAWLVRHDWILKRAILDDSFLPALEYLATDYTGEEVALITLEMAVQHQKSVVDKLSQQVMLANQSLGAATVGVTQAEDASVNDQRNREYGKFVQSFFDPLGISQAGNMDNGTSNRARLEFANEALDRAQAKVNDLTSQMKSEVSALQIATDKYTAAATRHYGKLAEIDRLRLHVKDNIIHYMQAIWAHEPADQRYFRIYNLDVPVFEHNTTVDASRSAAASDAITAKELLAAANATHLTYNVSLPKPTLSEQTRKLHQVADIDTLIGFKGNYMIFPLTDFDNYMTWYLIHNYIDFDSSGAFLSDPDQDADIDPSTLESAMAAIKARAPDTFAANEERFVDVMVQLLSNQDEQMVIVPSDQLYIEALPGTHPILEDFKLMHRALDVKKVQAEVRRAELENLRLAARLVNGEYGDPDVERKIVIHGNTDKIAVQPDGG